MFLKYTILFCVVLLFVNIDAFAKRDASPPPPDPLDAFKRNMEALRNCIDKSLSQTVGDVRIEKHLQPVFNILGDQINRFSKAFEDLTAPSSTTSSILSLDD